MRSVSVGAIGKTCLSRATSASSALWAAMIVAAFALCCGAVATCARADGAVRAVAGGVPGVVSNGVAQRVGERRASAPLHVSVVLPVREGPELEAAIAAASTPGSPSYGRYLSNAEYMARFAPTGTQVSAVESWLRGEGLRVTGSSKDNLLVEAQGSTATLERAFNVAIEDYRAGGREFFSSDRAPAVPTGLPVASVMGLSDYLKPVAESPCYAGHCGFSGIELRQRYDILGDAEGQTIAFTLWGKPVPESTYEEYAKVTDTPVLSIGPGAGQIEFQAEGSSENETTEVALDTEAAHAIAPGAHLVYYLGATEEFLLQELDDAVGSKATVISNSWGIEAPETCNTKLDTEAFEDVLQEGASEGKTFFFGAGDYGAAHGCTYPSSSPYAVAVGGTGDHFNAAEGITGEFAIDNGGDCDNAVSRPAWQTGIGTPYVYPNKPCTGRATPDVLGALWLLPRRGGGRRGLPGGRRRQLV